MLIIYQCFGGTHSSVVAAYIHLEKLSMDSVPGARELEDLPHFDRMSRRQLGYLHYIGTDRENNRIFALGSAGNGAEIQVFFRESLPLWEIPLTEISIVNCLSQVNFAARMGGYFSRGLGLTFIGRPLVNLGLRMRYRGIVRLVQEVKNYPGAYTLERKTSPVY